jgi:hypothetical protein
MKLETLGIAGGNGRPLIEPEDGHNQRLITAVHPPDWVNPQPRGRYNLVVVGAGTAGLVTASGSAASIPARSTSRP